jgi:hypothetical protein
VIGFRGIEEFDRKRILVSTDKSIHIFGYSSKLSSQADKTKIYTIINHDLPPDSRIISAWFAHDTDPNIVFAALEQPAKKSVSIVAIYIAKVHEESQSYTF